VLSRAGLTTMMGGEESEDSQENEQDLRNDEWLRENYLDLIQDYPNLWIAVLDQKVVATGNTKRQAELTAKEKVGDKRFSLYFIEPSGIMP